MTCTCNVNTAAAVSNVPSVDFSKIDELRRKGLDSLIKDFAPASGLDPNILQPFPKGLTTLVHHTSANETIVTNGFCHEDKGYVVANGMIDYLFYDLRMSLVLKGAEIIVSLEQKGTISHSPITWHFKLCGTTCDVTGEIISARSVELTHLHGLTSGSILNPICVLKCGGSSILGALASCLPSLLQGRAAYISCVVGKAPGAVVSVITCVAQNCT